MANDNFQKMSNIVKIDNRDKEMQYIFSTAIRMRPKVYDEYGCIIWQVKGSMLPYVINYLFPTVYYMGLEIEGSPQNKTIEVIDKNNGGSYELDDAYEIILKKIPAIKFLKDPKVDM